MNTKIRKYLLSLILFILAFVGLYLYAFQLQIGSAVKSNWWAKSLLVYKEYYSSTIQEKKLILSSGSNAMWGVNSQLLGEMTGYPTVNLGTHAELDIQFLYFQLQRHLKSGDIVVMPLEYWYYFDPINSLSEGFINDQLVWGKEYYLDNLSLKEYLLFIAKVPKSRVWEGLVELGAKSQLVDPKIVIEQTIAHAKKGNPKFDALTHLSLNQYGDMRTNRWTTRMVLNYIRTGNDYGLVDEDISALFIENFKKIQELVAQKNAQLVLTWPVTIKNKLFDMENSNHQDRVVRLIEKLKVHDIDLQCDPRLFNMDVKYFYNTEYHLRAVGANIRTKHLGQCINDIINPE